MVTPVFSHLKRINGGPNKVEPVLTITYEEGLVLSSSKCMIGVQKVLTVGRSQ